MFIALLSVVIVFLMVTWAPRKISVFLLRVVKKNHWNNEISYMIVINTMIYIQILILTKPDLSSYLGASSPNSAFVFYLSLCLSLCLYLSLSLYLSLQHSLTCHPILAPAPQVARSSTRTYLHILSGFSVTIIEMNRGLIQFCNQNSTAFSETAHPVSEVAE